MTARRNKQNYLSNVFGNWTVIEDLGCDKKHHYVRCKCTCGNKKVLKLDTIKNCKSRHCTSCWNHGYSKERLYNVWIGMRDRCYNENNNRYNCYGGRGIEVCEEWNNSYIAFREWALKNGYNENAKKGECTLDRIDVNGNYCPENCRWISNARQARNKRKLKQNTSGYTGIYYIKTGKRINHWRAVIIVNHKMVALGHFFTQKEALDARNKYIIDNDLLDYPIQKYVGELTILNNKRSLPIKNTSGYMGVCWHKERNKWVVGLTENGKHVNLGYYSNKREAVEARNKYIIDNNLTKYKIQEWKGE